MGGYFVDDDGRWRSAHRLSTAVLVQWGTAGGLLSALAGMAAEVFAARLGQRSPTVLSDAVAVVALSTPMRLRLSDFTAALMAKETHAVGCAEGRVDAAFAGLRLATQHLDRRWWARMQSEYGQPG
jgi:hypothetical protein